MPIDEEVLARRRVEGLVALVFTQFCFGMFPVLVKLATTGDPHGADGRGFTPRSLAAWRILGGALVLALVAYLRHPRAFVPNKRDLGRLVACSLFGIVLNQVLALEGAARTSATHAGILFTTIPVFTYGVAAACGQERFELRRALGILVGLSGAVLLVLARGGTVREAPAPALGSLFMILNCLSYSVYLVLARRLLERLPMLVVLAWIFLFALWAPPVLWLLGGGPVWPAAATGEALTGFAGLILVTTVLAYFFNTYALARVPASTTALFIFVQPLFSVGAAFVVLREIPGLSAYVASGLLFLGIALVLRRDRRIRA